MTKPTIQSQRDIYKVYRVMNWHADRNFTEHDAKATGIITPLRPGKAPIEKEKRQKAILYTGTSNEYALLAS